MTQHNSSQFQQLFPGPYSVRRNHDGVDETFEITCDYQHRTIASTYFWNEEEHCYVVARAIVAALNLKFHGETAELEDYECLEAFTNLYPGDYYFEFDDCPGRGEFVSINCNTSGEHLISCYGPSDDASRATISETIMEVLTHWHECE